MSEKRAKEAGIEYTVWKEEFRANDRGLAEGKEHAEVFLPLQGESVRIKCITGHE